MSRATKEFIEAGKRTEKQIKGFLMSMRGQYCTNSLSAPVRQRGRGKRIVMLFDRQIRGVVLRKGEELVVVNSCASSVSVKIPGSNETVILHDGAYRYI